MARRYSRDNRGRFASGGTGATARGGRLKTASGNKRATQTTKAAGAKPSGTVAGKVKRNPTTASKIGAAKPQTQISSARQAATDRLKIKTATRKKLSANRESVIPSKSKGPKTMRTQRVGSTVPKSIARTKGNEPAKVARRIDRKAAVNAANLKSITRTERTGATQGRQYERAIKSSFTLKRAKEFSSTGKLPGRDNSMTFKRQIKESTARINAKRAARTAATPAAPKAVKRKGKEKIDDSKVSRVIGRVNKVVRGSEEKTGVKRLNAIQVGVRAKSFLARKEGGNVGMLNQKGQPEAFASVRKAMTKPPKYSTQSPNRNKPGRFNDLGQDKARAKARADAMTGRERIAKANESAAANAKERKGKIPTGAMSRRSLPQLGAPQAPGYAKGPRQAGTIIKPKTSTTPVSSTVARTRTQAKAAQRNRREQILDRARTGVTGLGSMRKNPRIKRSDTGMRQLSLTGKAKTLYKFKPIKRR